MARFITLDALAFLLPFLVYGAWLFLSKKNAAHPENWPARTLLTLSAAGAVTIIVVIVSLIHFTGVSNSGTYHPAVYKDGHVVPGGFD